MNSRRTWLGAALVALLTWNPAAVQAQAKPREQLIGKWQTTVAAGDKDIKLTIQFVKDGKLTMEVKTAEKTQTIQGKFSFVDDGAIKIEMPSSGGAKAEETKFKVTDTELELIPPKGKVLKLKRVQ